MERLRERELLDRAPELAVLGRAQAAAGGGSGTLVLVDGPAGIGKTALVVRASDDAEATGALVLRGRGAARETGFAFGVVRQLFEPLLARLAPDELERAFQGAAGQARVLFDAVDPDAALPQDAGFTTLHGLYWLVVNLARDRTLLLVVDDVQWADPPSRRWVEHLAHRLDGLSVALVLARRPGEDAAADDLARELGRDPAAVPVPLGPLSPAATARLVRSAFDAHATDEFCATCHAVTGGNPLLVRQTTGELVRRGVRPTDDAAAGVTDLVASAIAELVASRLRTVGSEGVGIVAALSVLGPAADRRVTERIAELEPAAASSAIRRLQALDIVAVGPDLQFCHPLVHAAVEQHLGLQLLAETHRRAATVLERAGAAPDAIAPHLQLTSPAGDPWVVETLRSAAHAAASRGADDTARELLHRALAEPPASAADAARVHHDLGVVVSHTDMAAAVPILMTALDASADPLRRALIASDLASPLLVSLRTAESVELLDTVREALGDREPELSGALEAAALSNAQWDLRMGDVLAARQERCRRLASPETPVGRLVLVLCGVNDAITTGAEGVRQVRSALDAGLLDDLGAHAPPFGLACVTLVVGGDLAGAAIHLEHAEREVARTGSAVARSHLANMRAALHLYRGAPADAEAEAVLGLEAAVVPMGLPTLIGSLTDALVARGELDRAQETLERYGVQGEIAPLLGCLLLLGSRIRLKEARGDHAGVLEDCDVAASWMAMAGARTPLPMFWQPHASAAHLALGDHAEARRLADAGMDVAIRLGEPRAVAIARLAAARCVAGQEALEHLTRASASATEAGADLVLAAVEIDRGRALATTGRPADARDALRTAHRLATRAGATPVAARAHAALVAAGARPRSPSAAGPAALTPAELRVARLAAQGRSNRDAAEQLFVTVKTVEMHLSSAYRKLDIRSRSQLRGALEGEGAGET